MNQFYKYKDGFKIRALNRRVICIKKENDWFLSFIFFQKTKFTEKERKRFDFTFDRFNRTITKVTIRLTDEVFQLIGEGIIRFHYDK